MPDSRLRFSASADEKIYTVYVVVTSSATRLNNYYMIGDVKGVQHGASSLSQCEGRALGPEKILQPHVLMIIKRPAHSNSHRSIFPQ